MGHPAATVMEDDEDDIYGDIAGLILVSAAGNELIECRLLSSCLHYLFKGRVHEATRHKSPASLLELAQVFGV